MASEQKKRKLPVKVAAMKSRKRQKKDGVATTSTQPKLPTAAQNVRLDDLQWKEVSLPDGFDDFEGFFGLEEVDDVEVVHSGENTKISYRTTAPVSSKQEAHAAQASEGNNEVAKQPTEGSSADTGPVDEEWAGFGSEEEEDVTDGRNESVAARSASSQPVKSALKTKSATKNTEASADGNGVGSEQIGSIPFAGLLDEDTEDGADTTAWSPLGLSAETLSSLSKLGFSQPTPIQSSAIPEILAGHDVVGKASTGSGKTLAFGIPILEHYLRTKTRKGGKEPRAVKGVSVRPPLALVLSPTRELAHQISQHLHALCSEGTFDGPKIATATGGLSLQKQQRLIADADIIVGTPGRLWEIISEGHGLMKWLKEIKFLVVDEADRLLSEGHFKEVEEILNSLDRKNDGEEEASPVPDSERRQTLVFSATFQKDLQRKLAGKSKRNSDLMDKKAFMEYLIKKLNFREERPKFVDVNPISQMASGLKEGLVECAGTEKDLYLYSILMLHPNTRTLVFTNSITAVRRITPYLKNLNVQALSLHSGMIQKARLRSVERFTAGNNSILIATDVAARGLDIPGVQLIIHYHLPRAADDYVHRSGRTARAGKEGESILICAPEEVNGVRRLIARVHAQNSGKPGKNSYSMHSLDIDRRVVSRLKPRATLAKRVADIDLSKEKKRTEDSSMKQAAEDLGVEYDSEEMEAADTGRRGRGKGRKKKQRENREISKGEVQGMRAELKALLAQRVNVGVSPKYIAGGGVDVDALLEGRTGDFLGL